MAVRPPQDDSSDTESIEFGIAALDANFDGATVSFPTTEEALVDALGDPQVPYDASGNTMSLSDALASVPKSRFESKTEVLNVLHPVFEERRREASNSFLAQLRSLLPF
jgi:hypothetical protein